MLSLIETSPELMAAIFVAVSTVSAALVNAVSQVKVAREARRTSKPAPPASKRTKRWLLVGAALALGLGWSATVAPTRAQADDGSSFIGARVAAVLGPRRSVRGDVPANVSTVALLHFAQPLTERAAVDLLHAYDLRVYAIDLRLAGEPASWRAIPIGFAPDESVPHARRAALREAWQAACSLETAAMMPAASENAMEPRLVSDEATSDEGAAQVEDVRAAAARMYAQRLAADSAVIHALRVIGNVASATRASQDSVVARAEIMRYDTQWAVREAAAPADAGCEVMVLAAE